ncbi:MAG: S-layer homology domain-containing protein [Candidatus Peribacteraceae bacterium]|nr:S-layer homology domain-containing protein [Candidatus Peribacteraceae bacterium]
MSSLLQEKTLKPILTISAIVFGAFVFVASVHAQSVPFTIKAFTDVKKTSVNFTAIDYLREQNIVRGYPDGSFKETNRVRRSEFITLATNPFFLDPISKEDCIATHITASGTTVFFSDVPRESWFATPVCIAKVRNVLDGYPDGTFRGNDFISFVEGAKILSNVFVGTDRNDTDPVEWYKSYVQWLSDQKAIPTSVRSLSQPLTRGEMAEMIWRLKTNNRTKASATVATIAKK